MPYGVRQGRRVLIGMALIIGIVAIMVLVFFLSSLVAAARGTFTIVGVFFEAPRLRIGSTVQIAGYSVGEVTGIEVLPPRDTSPAPFAARLRIPERLSEQLRRDSRVRLRRHRLMGEPVVDLTPGTIGAPMLRPGDTLYAEPPRRPADIAEMGRAVREAIDSFYREEEALRTRAKALAARSDEIRRELTELRSEFNRLERQFDAGPLADLLTDESWRESLGRIGARVGEIERLTRARAATVSGAPVQASFDGLEERVAAIRAAISRLESLLAEPTGFPARWEYDPALRNAIEATRVQLDSLIEITRRKPWRYFF